jgi:hypothetical protein
VHHRRSPQRLPSPCQPRSTTSVRIRPTTDVTEIAIEPPDSIVTGRITSTQPSLRMYTRYDPGGTLTAPRPFVSETALSCTLPFRQTVTIEGPMPGAQSVTSTPIRPRTARDTTPISNRSPAERPIVEPLNKNRLSRTPKRPQMQLEVGGMKVRILRRPRGNTLGRYAAIQTKQECRTRQRHTSPADRCVLRFGRTKDALSRGSGVA